MPNSFHFDFLQKNGFFMASFENGEVVRRRFDRIDDVVKSSRNFIHHPTLKIVKLTSPWVIHKHICEIL